MAGQRKPIGPKLRFEIFKRDNFTCRYCGRSTPQVVLEIDHIVPVVEGGTNDPENLVTSCYECNRGKGATPLDSMPMGEDDIHENTVLLLEREMQLREYNEVRRQVRERQEREVKELLDYWCQIWGVVNRDSTSSVPDGLRLLGILEHVAAEDIRRAMTIAAHRTKSPYQGVKYFFGILMKWRRDGVQY